MSKEIIAAPLGPYNNKNKEVFRQLIWDYYREAGRSFPWRERHDAYGVLVSEMMLQQTQTQRVLPKYEAWMETFPTWEALADAAFLDVAVAWQGLGYNRRAKALHQIAKQVVESGFPQDEAGIRALPQVGPSTTAAIGAFCHGSKQLYLETNVRRVLLYFFFEGVPEVRDKELYALLEDLIADEDNPREWYYALMDYGVLLAAHVANPNRRSRHYAKQSKFEGSLRQLRGLLLRICAEEGAKSYDELVEHIDRSTEDIDAALDALCKEGMLVERENAYEIAD